MDEKMHWTVHRTVAWPNEDEAFLLEFPCYEDFDDERAHKELALGLERNRITWLARKNKRWSIDLDAMSRFAPNATDFPWLRGMISVEPKLTRREKDRGYLLTFKITEEYMNETAPKKIFLSHKGVDKQMVRTYHATLKELGFDPWLDEEAMSAGANLERALLQGMRDSCAAIFFVTEHYVDEGFLATEVDYAVQEKRRKGARFAIITLDLSGGRGRVPDLLSPYVWKSPRSEFEALSEILRALPIALPAPQWK